MVPMQIVATQCLLERRSLPERVMTERERERVSRERERAQKSRDMKDLAMFAILSSTPPLLAPPPSPAAAQQPPHLKRASFSLNVLSFGFLATAILISVFIVVALFERFLHRTPSSSSSSLSSPSSASSTLAASAPDNALFVGQASGVASYSREDIGMLPPEKRCLISVSVLMPGQVVPTFIARPAPITHFREAHDDDTNNAGPDNPTRDTQ